MTASSDDEELQAWEVECPNPACGAVLRSVAPGYVLGRLAWPMILHVTEEHDPRWPLLHVQTFVHGTQRRWPVDPNEPTGVTRRDYKPAIA